MAGSWRSLGVWQINTISGWYRKNPWNSRLAHGISARDGTHFRASPVNVFSHEAIQTTCRYLSLPLWCVPNGDIVRCSWIVFFSISRLGSCVSLRSSLAGNLAQGGTHRGWQDVCFFFLSQNGCDLPPVKLYHLSCFGFGKNNSTHCALRFANPNAVLAILLSLC